MSDANRWLHSGLRRDICVVVASLDDPTAQRAKSELAREAADADDIEVQLQATGSRTGTDADAFYTSRGGIPALNIGLPNRYMHTPVEVIDTEDLDAVAELLGAIAAHAGDIDSFAVDI